MTTYVFWYLVTAPVNLEIARRSAHIKNPGMYLAQISRTMGIHMRLLSARYIPGFLMWIPMVREICAAGYFIPYAYKLLGDSVSYNHWGEAMPCTVASIRLF